MSLVNNSKGVEDGEFLDASVTELIATLRNRISAEDLKHVIVTAESAAVIFGFSPSTPFPVTLVTLKPIEIDGDDITILGNGVLRLYDTVDIEGIHFAKPIHAICDMLLHDGNPQVIVEAMCFYYYSYGKPDSWSGLEEFAKYYNVYSEFLSYIEDAIDHGSNH